MNSTQEKINHSVGAAEGSGACERAECCCKGAGAKHRLGEAAHHGRASRGDRFCAETAAHESSRTDGHTHDHACGCCHSCASGHSHEHDNGVEVSEIIRLCVGAAGLLLALLLPLPPVVRLGMYLLAYLVSGGEVLWTAVRNLVRGRVFDENFLMSIATAGAFCIGEYPEGVMVMLLYQLGELLQGVAVGRSRKSIAKLMDIRPDYANVRRNGSVVRVSPAEVQAGETVVIQPGERVPLDGVVLSGTSTLDTRALTGESLPREVLEGGQVLSGCINLSGLLTVRVARTSNESTVAKILELVEHAGEKKAQSEQFITKFARVYTPVVVIIALLLAFVPPLILKAGLSEWVYRALVFLVISCPCALVISVPLSFFAGVGGASRRGILVKGGNYLEALARVDTVVFDKTGTLTKGVFDVQELHADGMDASRLLQYAAYAEYSSSHPIARAVVRKYGREIDETQIESVVEEAGFGVTAQVLGAQVIAGNRAHLQRHGILCPDAPDSAGTLLYVAVDGRCAGYFVVSDEVKEDAADAIAALKRRGVRKTVMLTGDREAAAQAVAQALSIDETHARLLPADKVQQVEQLLRETPGGGSLAFVGDGINDAPVLTVADIGVAMGGIGSDAAIEAADVVLMDDQPSKLADAIALSRRTLRIVRQNIALALVMKLLVLALGAFGLATMWEAVFADVGVALIAVLNAMRAMRAAR